MKTMHVRVGNRVHAGKATVTMDVSLCSDCDTPVPLGRALCYGCWLHQIDGHEPRLFTEQATNDEGMLLWGAANGPSLWEDPKQPGQLLYNTALGVRARPITIADHPQTVWWWCHGAGPNGTNESRLPAHIRALHQ